MEPAFAISGITEQILINLLHNVEMCSSFTLKAENVSKCILSWELILLCISFNMSNTVWNCFFINYLALKNNQCRASFYLGLVYLNCPTYSNKLAYTFTTNNRITAVQQDFPFED